jgi:hypothetical protein
MPLESAMVLNHAVRERGARSEELEEMVCSWSDAKEMSS